MRCFSRKKPIVNQKKTMTSFSLKRKAQLKESLASRRSAQNEDSSESEDEAGTANMEDVAETLPPRGRPRPPKNLKQSPGILRNALEKLQLTPNQTTPTKRHNREQQQLAADMDVQKIQAESFVMKLFDRSLDLSKYTEQTPLYPVCRAWMANTPRNPSIRSFREHKSPVRTKREDNGLEILTKLRSGEMCEVYAMPAPGKTELSVIPTPLPNDELDEVHDDNEEDLTKDKLLAQHKIRWNKVKDNWRTHTKCYQKRYEINRLILKELFQP